MQVIVKNETTSGRSVLEGAFALLEVLADGEDRGLTGIAAAAGLPKATAHRLLDQLVNLGAVQRRGGRYTLGPRTFRLGQSWRPARLLRAAAARPLGRLAATTERGGFSLAVAEAGQTILVTGIGREVNEVFPLRAGVLLPPGTAAEKIIRATTPFTEPPQGYSTREWAQAASTARDRGLAYDLDMRAYAVACVAAPVRAPSGTVVAALAATTFEARRIDAVTEAVRRTADQISVELVRLVRAERAASPWPGYEPWPQPDRPPSAANGSSHASHSRTA
ncbi:helix-turn-helix domain-containing protein [Nocardia sp. CDC159]|uniref:Helix-turn-helix domain-containing protein n=1 Tax=Nocardia pulmonis TaxID=2951408 RepID=A0A9X2EAL3_9NOCA|nr:MULTISPECIES: helix-turn-helix domain-containing protein [Nocardia]MCM6776736.1 helix-turn-helix domain-containing protein [Nocardia pulmonis]MCM6789115.1 helix-turn-helix domain-containing protein [Nocardia sp. CDC159]